MGSVLYLLFRSTEKKDEPFSRGRLNKEPNALVPLFRVVMPSMGRREATIVLNLCVCKKETGIPQRDSGSIPSGVIILHIVWGSLTPCMSVPAFRSDDGDSLT